MWEDIFSLAGVRKTKSEQTLSPSKKGTRWEFLSFSPSSTNNTVSDSEDIIIKATPEELNCVIENLKSDFKASYDEITPSSEFYTSESNKTEESLVDVVLENTENTAISSSKSKKKSKKKHSKSKQIISAQPEQDLKPARRISWGVAEQIFFSREVSKCAVPNKGSYPLGLGQEVERLILSVDEFYLLQQQELKERATAIITGTGTCVGTDTNGKFFLKKFCAI
jgi:hypothetical protein